MAQKNSTKSKTKGPRLEELFYYFDGVEQGRIDSAGRDMRASELLALRERLLRMPVNEFQAAIKTIRSVVDDQVPEGDLKSGTAGHQKRAQYLYDETRTERKGATISKITPT